MSDKKVVMHGLGHLPDGYGSYEYEPLSPYDAERLENNGVVQVFYWYGVGDWCGTGQLLMLDEHGRWHLHDAGHCSCYGPTEEMKFGEGKQTLGEMQRGCSDELWKDVAPLATMALMAGLQ